MVTTMKTNIPVMINGKVKGAIPVNVDESKESVMAKAMNLKPVNTIVDSENTIQTVYVPGRMFNVVVKLD